MSERFIFLDGKMVMVKSSSLESLSPGILSGRGIFETMRVYGGKIFALEEHLDRLFRGLRILRLTSACPRFHLARHCYIALLKNRLKEARIRITVWQKRGHEHLAVVALPYRPPLSSAYKQGFKAFYVPFKKENHFLHPSVKSLDYLPFLKAYRKAVDLGGDEAILVNGRGFIMEGSRSNVFLVRKGRLETPSLQSGCLDGITRQIVIQIAKKMNIPVRVVSIKAKEFFQAEEAFLTNSLMEIMPFTFVENHRIGPGRVGPVTLKFIDGYRTWVQQSLLQISPFFYLSKAS